MTPQEFNKHLKALESDFKELFLKTAPTIASKTAVSYFKKNFQNEAWGRSKWKEVQRRTPGSKAYKYAGRHHPARTTRKILTGDTGDLGRSIEIKEISKQTAVVWTSTAAFGSKEPYGRVHNEGLRAGRGKGFIMPKRQFMGESNELNQLIIKELERKLNQLLK